MYLLEALRNTSDNISLLHRSITSVDFSVLSEEEKNEIKTMLKKYCFALRISLYARR
jgi:hypothetical protein